MHVQAGWTHPLRLLRLLRPSRLPRLLSLLMVMLLSDAASLLWSDSEPRLPRSSLLWSDSEPRLLRSSSRRPASSQPRRGAMLRSDIASLSCAAREPSRRRAGREPSLRPASSSLLIAMTLAGTCSADSSTGMQRGQNRVNPGVVAGWC